jgi:SAM-dependent methyltransferase
MTPCLLTDDGRTVALDARRWFRAADAVDRRALGTVRGPTLDIGCGPGRHVVALSELGVPTLGIDITPAAVRFARAQGAPVLRRCVFDRVPGAGRWRSALLFDGNVGIGGDPPALLARIGELLAPDGAVLVELAGPGSARFDGRVRFVTAAGHTSGPWFDWATVTVADLGPLATAAAFHIRSVTGDAGRWFAWLDR